MPVKNALPYLEECLASICQQSMGDWELLAVDDGSSDGSFDLLAHWATQDGRIHAFKTKGSGIIAALRLAFAESSGAFITRMDADDLMAPEKLAELSSALVAKGRGHLATGLVRYFATGRPLGEGYARYEAWLNRLTLEARNFEEIYKECSIPSPCWMLHRDDLQLCGAFAPNTYPEDYDLAFRFMERGLKVVGVPRVLHLWRDHSARTSRHHEHYADNRFLDLKIDYFLRMAQRDGKKLVLWGAGAKGKALAQRLAARKIPFIWVADSPNKLGKHIYGQLIHAPECLLLGGAYRAIVAVAARGEQASISDFLDSLAGSSEAYWFC